ncbi:MAG: Protein of unknown function (DUF1553)/Protein of unknown function (DUF1549)/Planctomycete, partial [Verrucomicrobia bacterium]|nr:Protein of unknown function (DUF1553)/Protein of unknown function (DUF1549)/Planctomycete [Verrucomicrobiota bacterium]
MPSPTPPLSCEPRRNLAREMVARLREEIISGRFNPGEALAEPVLAARFEVSRAPIREALIELEREGLVQFESTGRTRVRRLTEKDFDEIMEARVALEGTAARKAAAVWTSEDTAWVENNIAAQARASTLAELSRLDVEMHEFILRRGGNERLAALWQCIRAQFEMGLAYTHRLQQKLEYKPRRITVESHRSLLAAVASGKPEVARRAMVAHIQGSREWSLAQPVTTNGNGRVVGAKAAAVAIALLLTATLLSASAEIAPDAAAFFEAKVRPLLVDRCYDCHSGARNKGGLSLETREGWTKGGENGPAIVPGKPDDSLLIKAVRYADADLAMPPKKKGGKLSDEEVATLEKWVRMGAPDPREPAAKIGGMNAAEAKAWWAFQPLPPPGAAPGSSAQIDTFVDARLAAANLLPSPPADKRTLLRRASYDLTGLPPTPEEVAAFVADPAPDAFARAVDRLLASPHYGEQWGRHWLDVVRYADSLDSRSYGKPGDILDAWRYRDWVVDAFNRDLPYDQFITDQLAGDILAARAWDPQKVIATGLYAIGNWGNGDADKEKLHTDIVDDQIDVTGRAFLGLTLACARCHDHKFDPITTRDYYGMAGIFFSSRILEKFASKGAGESLMRIPLLSPEQTATRNRTRQRLAEIDAQLSGGLEPFTEVKKNAAGKPGLISWKGRAADNPSLVINTADAPVAFSTIKLPARAIAMHPGPKVPATAVWRSPIAGTVKVSAQLEDADPNCGDGIVWLLRHGNTTLQTGVMNNAASAEVPETAVTVQPGDLLKLVITPRADYTCDTTRLEFVVHAEDGTKWDLREALVGGATQGQDNVWWLCAGDGPSLNAENPDAKALAEQRKQVAAELELADFAEGLQEGGIAKTPYEGYH